MYVGYYFSNYKRDKNVNIFIFSNMVFSFFVNILEVYYVVFLNLVCFVRLT